MALLEIDRLSVDFNGFKAVSDFDLSIAEGEVVGIVGESGSGKSVSQLAMMGLIPFPGVITASHMRFDGNDLLSIPAKKRRQLVGKDIAMIFQEPMTSLNPCFTIGFQIMEALKTHEGGYPFVPSDPDHRPAGPGGDPGTGRSIEQLSPSDVRGYESAGHDCHGHRLPSPPAGCG